MKKFGRTAALVLSAVLTVSSVLPAYAAEGTNELKGQFSYIAQDGTVFEKVSHPDTGLERRYCGLFRKRPDWRACQWDKHCR